MTVGDSLVGDISSHISSAVSRQSFRRRTSSLATLHVSLSTVARVLPPTSPITNLPSHVSLFTVVLTTECVLPEVVLRMRFSLDI